MEEYRTISPRHLGKGLVTYPGLDAEFDLPHAALNHGDN
jgi:hypothetical protein